MPFVVPPGTVPGDMITPETPAAECPRARLLWITRQAVRVEVEGTIGEGPTLSAAIAAAMRNRRPQ